MGDMIYLIPNFKIKDLPLNTIIEFRSILMLVALLKKIMNVT